MQVVPKSFTFPEITHHERVTVPDSHCAFEI